MLNSWYFEGMYKNGGQIDAGSNPDNSRSMSARPLIKVAFCDLMIASIAGSTF
jgi:hypothetical protein